MHRTIADKHRPRYYETADRNSPPVVRAEFTSRNNETRFNREILISFCEPREIACGQVRDERNVVANIDGHGDIKRRYIDISLITAGIVCSMYKWESRLSEYPDEATWTLINT